MKLNRRQMLAGTTLAGPASAMLNAQAAAFRLRYAPRVRWLQGLSVPQQLETYAKAGLRAFEHNGLPGHTMQEIEQIRKTRDEHGMAMGVFVVNRGGWRPTSLPD